MSLQLCRRFLLRTKSINNFGIDNVSTVLSTERKFRRFSNLKNDTCHEDTNNVLEPAESTELEPLRNSFSCVTVPDNLTRAAKVVLEDSSDATNKLILSEANNFCNVIRSRKLSIERPEYFSRYGKLVDDYLEKGILSIEKVEMIVEKKLASEIYRWHPIEFDEANSRIYMAAKLAAHYASLSSVFKEIKVNMPSFQPTTFFDYASNVGVANWAAHEAWGDSILEYFYVHGSTEMITLADLLLKGGDKEGSIFLKKIFFRQFLPVTHTINFDLVVSTHSLMELPSLKERLKVIDILWRKTKNTLVFIENGSHAGFSAVLDARDYVLHIVKKSQLKDPHSTAVAHVVAPCPHDEGCPKIQLGSKIPCNFVVPYNTILKHPQTVEKEMFSYVVIQKQERPQGIESWPRLIYSSRKKSKLVQCSLCCSDGNLRMIGFTKSKHGSLRYQCAKKTKWGNLLPFPLSDLKKRDDGSFENENTKCLKL